MSEVVDIANALGGLTSSVQTMQQAMNQMTLDHQKLVHLVEKLTAENKQLRQELAETRAERDEYETALRYQCRRATAITEEDIRDMEQSGLVSREFRDIINELEQAVHANRP